MVKENRIKNIVNHHKVRKAGRREDNITHENIGSWKTDGLVVTELREPIMLNSKQEMEKVEKLRNIILQCRILKRHIKW